MKMVIAFLLVALCSSLGTGNSISRDRRQMQMQMKYTYHKGGETGGDAVSAEQQTQFSKDQAQMFCFLFQGLVCLYNGVRNGPANRKAESYKFIVANTIEFVKTTAASVGCSTRDLFLDENAYNIYLQLKQIYASGDYGNIEHVENCFDGLVAGLGGALGGILKGFGLAANEIGLCLTGILGGLAGMTATLVGGILNTAGSLVGGAANLAVGVVGGLANLAGGILGGVTNALGGVVGGSGSFLGGGSILSL